MKEQANHFATSTTTLQMNTLLEFLIEIPLGLMKICGLRWLPG